MEQAKFNCFGESSLYRCEQKKQKKAVLHLSAGSEEREASLQKPRKSIRETANGIEGQGQTIAVWFWNVTRLRKKNEEFGRR